MIADWLKLNPQEMPIKCEFDSLIRDGSSEWRRLCENKAYIEQFPSKHFDLDTVLQAKITHLSVVSEKSFVGFFIPEELEDKDFDFLHSTMSFDSIWEEISPSASELCRKGEPLVYIVSWNDHFFVLKVEQDVYYIIDTLGERLYERCNQAYILKFNKDTAIKKLQSENQVLDEKLAGIKEQINEPEETVGEGAFVVCAKDTAMEKVNNSKDVDQGGASVVRVNDSGDSDRMEESICRGKQSCKEYIKSFLAAIPIRELQVEVKKGLIASLPLHHRLQIEFHYTELMQPMIR